MPIGALSSGVFASAVLAQIGPTGPVAATATPATPAARSALPPLDSASFSAQALELLLREQANCGET